MKDAVSLAQHYSADTFIVPVGFRVLPIIPVVEAKAALPRFWPHANRDQAQRVWEARPKPVSYLISQGDQRQCLERVVFAVSLVTTPHGGPATLGLSRSVAEAQAGFAWRVLPVMLRQWPSTQR
jgi:hypothetical protein